MTRFSKRRSLLTLALCGIVFTSVACEKMESDQRQADRKVQDSVAAGVKSRRLTTNDALDKAITELNKAAGETAASLPNKIRARSLLAQTEFEAGVRTARELNSLSPAISRTLWEIGQTAAQVQQYNDSAKALEATNPEVTLAAIAAKRGEMAAAADAAGKKATELQGEIDKIKGQVNALIQQKDAALAAADADADRASKATGKDASDLADKAGEGRRKGAVLGHDIDQVSAGLLPLERDLAVEQGKKQTADEAVAALDAKKTVVGENWDATKKKIQAQQETAAKLGEELSTKAQALAALNKQAADLRTKATGQLSKSAEHYAATTKDATALATQLGQWSSNEKFSSAPEKKAWDQLKAVYNLNLFKLLDAEADNALGEIYSVQATQLRVQQQLVTGIDPALKAARIALPPALGTAAALDEEYKKAVAAAGTAYGNASQKFLDVYGVGTNPKDLKDAARVSRMFSLYGQYLDSEKTNKAMLDEARKEYQEAFGTDRKDDPIVRTLPADLRA